jgi:hypothetical protein
MHPVVRVTLSPLQKLRPVRRGKLVHPRRAQRDTSPFSTTPIVNSPGEIWDEPGLGQVILDCRAEFWIHPGMVTIAKLASFPFYIFSTVTILYILYIWINFLTAVMGAVAITQLPK